MSRFYITTPIYYVNDAPHLGHAYTTILADAFARFHRALGRDVHFLTGTDEHGLKIEEAANKRGIKPIELANDVVNRFKTTWKNLNISNDDFIRTTEQRHIERVQKMWKKLKDAGDIYESSYDGWYCVGCEAYYPESQLEDDKNCPVHKRKASWVSEPSYFFRMSKYQDKLLEHIDKNPNFISPTNYRNEIVSFLKSGLRDLSVSRTTFSWGVKVPDDPKHVIYVWIDALTNYMSALGDDGSELSNKFWPADCHLIGKDILRFHAVYWPCMLLSAGLPLPKQVCTHGWWKVGGGKISKSLPATRVDPNELAADLGADALRYFLLREVPLGNDGDFSYDALLTRFNSDLANDLGNLLGRCVTMAVKFTDGKVPKPHTSTGTESVHDKHIAQVKTLMGEITQHWEAKDPYRALDRTWALIRLGNQYVDQTQPWVMAKDPSKKTELESAIRLLLETAFVASQLVAPVMPSTSKAMLGILNASKDAVWPQSENFGTFLPANTGLKKTDPLFPRLDKKSQDALLEKWTGGNNDKKDDKKVEDKEQGPAEVSFGDFQKFDFRVARIQSAEPVPKAKKLLRLMVSLGEGEKQRQVVAGIAEAYDPEKLVGRKVIFLANLAPAKIRGVISEGMILAAGDSEILGLSSLDVDVPEGTVVR